MGFSFIPALLSHFLMCTSQNPQAHPPSELLAFTFMFQYLFWVQLKQKTDVQQIIFFLIDSKPVVVVTSQKKRAKLGCLEVKRTSFSICIHLLSIISVSVLIQHMYPWCPISKFHFMDQI